ncbi:MAG: Alpha-L-arabinofuranosidase-like protein [Pedosphaera sp.]|nr:Alpha-L-arabinofuranosidase-like protein [Pedosphaera sp.]
MKRVIQRIQRRAVYWLLIVCVMGMTSAQSQGNLQVYGDKLVNGWQDWGWAPGRNLAYPTNPAVGANCIQFSTVTYEAVSFHHTPFDTSAYTNLTFWIKSGGGTPSVHILMNVENPGETQVANYPLNISTSWQKVTLPLSSLASANRPNFSRISFQGSGSPSTFYLDDIQFTANPVPALTHISVNATQTVRTVDARWFGINTAIWDSAFDTAGTISLLGEMGMQTMRFPGGSASDEYHWATGKSSTNTWSWATSFANFAHVATNLGAQACITVNYGTGTPVEAAAWVRHANVTNHYAFKYWEVGNENYGTWETDSNTFPHDPYTYAVRAKDYMQQMRAADPTIKVGVVVTPGENSYANGYTAHPAINPRTGTTNYGWTAVMLSTLKSLSVTPDFVIYHRYPQNPGEENDATLLQSSGGWAVDGAELRQEMTDYFGAGSAGIEILCTENNSVSSGTGKQTTSLVGALFMADSLGRLMKTELNSLYWWDLRNGQDFANNNDASLYGWRNYGDYGIVNGQTDRYPTFYAGKLMQYFARGGDTVLNATSDYQGLAAYAVRRASGALTLLVINKDPLNSMTGQVNVASFIPGSASTIRSYGMPQDNAAQTNGAQVDITQTGFASAGTNFNYTVPPYSLTLLTLAPTALKLVALPPTPSAPTQFVTQIQGQPGVRYAIQSTMNLTSWISVSTNTLAGSTLNVTNAATPGAKAQFWRAVWLP